MIPISHIEILDLLIRVNKSEKITLDIRMLNKLESMLRQQNLYCTFSYGDLVDYVKTAVRKVKISDDAIELRPTEKCMYNIRYISNMYLTNDKIKKFNSAWATLELK